MAITNGYTSLEAFKNYANITSTDATDDTVIETLIEAASRQIDAHTGRTFYARTETHYFDVPMDTRELLFDDDLLTVTTLTNGDGNTIASTEYNFMPRNHTPYYGLKLKESSTYYWWPDSDGNFEDVISVAGTWGYAASTPDNVELACQELTKVMYHRRTGQEVEGVANITAAGVVITPSGIPRSVAVLLTPYKKRL